jgi:hypothetical protein
VTIEADGWLGKWLRFKGKVIERGGEVSSQEYQDILTLYEIEKEEADKERALTELKNSL